MKRIMTVIALLSAVALLITGCGISAIPGATTEEKNQVSDLIKTVQKAQTAKTDEEAASAIINGMVEQQVKAELDNFNKIKSIDAPKGLPAELLYPNGKITSSQNNGSDDYMALDINIKTTDSLQTVQDYYKAALAKTPWNVTEQSNEINQFNYFAKVTGNDYLAASIWGYGTDYSKLVEVTVSYSGPITK